MPCRGPADAERTRAPKTNYEPPTESLPQKYHTTHNIECIRYSVHDKLLEPTGFTA